MSLTNTSDLDQFTPDSDGYAQASYSSITMHRKCPQAWYYRHSLKLEPDTADAGPYLTIGRWWSALKAAEALERGRAAESLLTLPRKLDDKQEGYSFDPATVTVEDVLKASERRWRAFSGDGKDEVIEALGATLPERLRGMYELWDAAHADRHGREHPLGVEMFWKRELPRPERDLAWSMLSEEALAKLPKMNLIGFVDQVYLDRERDMVVISDDKAQKDISRSNSSVDDMMDSQLMLYAWGIAPALKRLGAPQARAVSYDRTRSVAAKTPAITATGRLSMGVTAYDLNTYLEWVRTDGRPSGEIVREVEIEQGMTEGGLSAVLDRMEPGPFWGKLGDFYKTGAKKGLPRFGTLTEDPDMIEKLSTPVERMKWTDRVTKPLNHAMIRAHLRAAVDTSLDIFETQTRADATGEAARNLDRMGCSWCDFRDLCRAQLIGGPNGDYDLEALGLRVKTRTPRTQRTGDQDD